MVVACPKKIDKIRITKSGTRWNTLTIYEDTVHMKALSSRDLYRGTSLDRLDVEDHQEIVPGYAVIPPVYSKEGLDLCATFKLERAKVEKDFANVWGMSCGVTNGYAFLTQHGGKDSGKIVDLGRRLFASGNIENIAKVSREKLAEMVFAYVISIQEKCKEGLSPEMIKDFGIRFVRKDTSKPWGNQFTSETVETFNEIYSTYIENPEDYILSN